MKVGKLTREEELRFSKILYSVMWYIPDTHVSLQNMTEFCIKNQLHNFLSTECDHNTITNDNLEGGGLTLAEGT